MKLTKILLVCFSCVATISFTQWQPNFETAKRLAKENHRLILLNFSGSDWCGPCMRMHKEIFGNENFLKMADTTLEMVNADFPRKKKNQLQKEKVKENELLADKYNSEGKFPFTLLLDADGKVIKIWDGLPDESAKAFTNEVKKYYDNRK